jgi:hypothetical protein
MVADLATCAETLPPLAMMRVTGLEPDRPPLPTVDRIDPWASGFDRYVLTLDVTDFARP